MHTLWESLVAALTPGAVIVCSPAHLGRLDGIAPISPQQAPSRIFSAGAPLSFEASRQTKETLGCSPTEIFGSTETGAFATRTQANGSEPWRLLPGMSMRTDDSGHLVLHSPFVGPDWLTTDDLIEQQDGGFRFLGRADRIVKIEGARVSLIEIERALMGLAVVKAAAAVVLPGKPDRLAAAVVPSAEGRIALDEIGNFRFGAFLRSKLALTQEAAGLPRAWRFVDKLPSQGLGKQCNADICALFGDGK
jgi:acyl-coenzyme A synthetase/AMP-(fatty) acid ligase